MSIKVISGGTTGADEAGLQAAYDLGISTGGTAIYNSDIAKFPQYNLQEHNNTDWAFRQVQNVKDSELTVWFGYIYSEGGQVTVQACKELSKLLLVNPTVEELLETIVFNRVKVVNIAGNRVSSFNPDIFDKTYSIVYKTLSTLKQFKHDFKHNQQRYSNCRERHCNSVF